MGPERWQQIEEIYYSILEVPPEERQALLDRVFHGDLELRREIESLLGCRVYLGLNVRTVEKWRNDDVVLDQLELG